MRTDWRAAAGLVITLIAVLGIVAGISFARASGGSDVQRYEVTVRFDTSVTQDDLDETGGLLRSYDDDLEFLIMESFPPVGRAVMEVEASDFCRTVEAELEAKSYVSDVSCRTWTGGSVADPDAPVSTDNDLD